MPTCPVANVEVITHAHTRASSYHMKGNPLSIMRYEFRETFLAPPETLQDVHRMYIRGVFTFNVSIVADLVLFILLFEHEF